MGVKAGQLKSRTGKTLMSLVFGGKKNKQILNQVKPHLSLESQIIKLKLSSVGHIMRRTNSLEKTATLGTVEGKGESARPATRWIAPIEAFITNHYEALTSQQKTQHRG